MDLTLVIQIIVATVAVLVGVCFVGGTVFLLREDSKSYPPSPGN